VINYTTKLSQLLIFILANYPETLSLFRSHWIDSNAFMMTAEFIFQMHLTTWSISCLDFFSFHVCM